MEINYKEIDWNELAEIVILRESASIIYSTVKIHRNEYNLKVPYQKRQFMRLSRPTLTDIYVIHTHIRRDGTIWSDFKHCLVRMSAVTRDWKQGS
jgi:hypothetical protein